MQPLLTDAVDEEKVEGATKDSVIPSCGLWQPNPGEVAADKD